MSNFNPNQIRQIENTPPNPKAIYGALGSIMNNSSTCQAKVESINPSTGEYRISLTGTYETGTQTTDPTQKKQGDRNWEKRGGRTDREN